MPLDHGEMAAVVMTLQSQQFSYVMQEFIIEVISTIGEQRLWAIKCCCPLLQDIDNNEFFVFDSALNLVKAPIK